MRNETGKRKRRQTFSKDAEGEFDDEEQDTASRGESEDLGHEAFVECRGAFFAENRNQAV